MSGKLLKQEKQMSNIKKNDVITVMTSIGEYIGKYTSEDGGSVTVNDPRLIVNTPEGDIGFGRGVCMSAKENPDQVIFQDVLFVVKTNDSFEKAYIEAVSGLIV